jgi:hypothetical protein
MKRVLLEWGWILSIGMAVAILGIWVYSKFFDRSTFHLRISMTRSVGGALHFLARDGNLSLCDQFEVDPTGRIGPLIIDTTRVTAADIRRGARFGGCTIPGFDLRYFRFASGDYLIWSVSLSLLVLAAPFFLLALLLRNRLQRLLRGVGSTDL